MTLYLSKSPYLYAVRPARFWITRRYRVVRKLVRSFVVRKEESSYQVWYQEPGIPGIPGIHRRDKYWILTFSTSISLIVGKKRKHHSQARIKVIKRHSGSHHFWLALVIMRCNLATSLNRAPICQGSQSIINRGSCFLPRPKKYM